jgi:hypothetical protein
LGQIGRILKNFFKKVDFGPILGRFSADVSKIFGTGYFKNRASDWAEIFTQAQFQRDLGNDLE